VVAGSLGWQLGRRRYDGGTVVLMKDLFKVGKIECFGFPVTVQF
jgi:hypothetical protein